MNEHSPLFVAVVAAAATLISALISGSVAYAVSKRSLLTEDRTSRLIVRIMRHGKRRFRTFETLQRRIGGFSDDELRRQLVRAGAVRFYVPWGEVYLIGTPEGEMLSHFQPSELMKPVEVWSLWRQPLLGWRPTLATKVLKQEPSSFDPEMKLNILIEAEDMADEFPRPLVYFVLLLLAVWAYWVYRVEGISFYLISIVGLAATIVAPPSVWGFLRRLPTKMRKVRHERDTPD